MLIKGSEAGKLAGKEGRRETAGTHSGAKACEFVCVWRGITLSPSLPCKWKIIHAADQKEGKLHAFHAHPFFHGCNIAHL